MLANKKSQIEIMGLIVIVILVVLGFLVYIILSSMAPKNDITTETTDELAQNFLTSFVKTDTNCGHSMTKLIRDCNLDQQIDCGGIDSCGFVQETAVDLLNQTLEVWGYAYYFEIPRMGFNHSNPHKVCGINSNRGTQGFEMISLYGRGDVVLTLDICR